MRGLRIMDEQSSTQTFHRQPGPDGVAGPGVGTKDGTGSGDHDQPFHGFRAYYFTSRQMIRLLILRSDALDARLGVGPYSEEPGSDADVAT
jgi:hypothetical protein